MHNYKQEGVVSFFEIMMNEREGMTLLSTVNKCDFFISETAHLIITFIVFPLHLPSPHPRCAAEPGVRTAGTCFAEIGRRRERNRGVMYLFE
jgi:hypothetical protein